jgi:acetyl esterase/lipase
MAGTDWQAWLPWIWLAATIVGAWFTFNVFRPMRWPAPLAGVSFFAGWLTAELAIHHLLWQLLATLGFAWLGAIRGWPGVAGVVLTAGSWLGLFWSLQDARRAGAAIEAALQQALGADYRQQVLPALAIPDSSAIDWKQLLVPVPSIHHPAVERIADLPYVQHGKRPLKLDVYRHRDRPTRCPMLLQIHGGGWVIGSKNEQGLPLMHRLAARGWVCVSVDYRLSPRATFPDHLIDVKHALRWMREHAVEYGGDPDFIVVTGGSAGGHLASLMALTANDPAYQPGFETTDTSLAGCVAFYGVYDFVDRNSNWPHPGMRKLAERHVVKAKFGTAPERFHAASPMSRVHAEAPPMLIVHGDRDTLVPVAEARHFFEAYRQSTAAVTAYAEIPGAQHAFEIFPSLRTVLVLDGVERFLTVLLSRYLAVRDGASVAAAG